MLKEIMRGFDEDMYVDEAAANNDAMAGFLGWVGYALALFWTLSSCFA